MHVHQLTVGMMGVCTYIIFCEKSRHAAIIDPGGDEDRILDYCKQEELQVKYILNTHGHPDHVCGNGPIKDATGAQIVMHRADVEYFSDPQLKQYFSALGLPESPPADIIIEDGDTITIGEETLEVIHTPGHSPGGVCYYSAPNLFTGDTLFVGAVGRTDFPQCSMAELTQSIQNKILQLPGETIVWPGHGYGGSQSTLDREKRTNPYF
ncbi:MBL fold metallo-hydrolase [Desulfogranum japonicum]|uniref:MBL fold metallo-hydrolase n=1 Tax=Desulfogranum japonicum TaxID=231447 RepID=UPI00040F880B|nr:MBL fold metallo-hydrolase [Desulfogranum japonicum]